MPDAPFAKGGFPRRRASASSIRARMLADGLDPLPTYTRAVRIGRQQSGTGRKISAGDDFAAGAQLPQFDLRQRARACAAPKASRTSTSIPADAPRAASQTATWCASSTTAASFVAKARVTDKARAGPGGGPVGLVEEARHRRQERQRSDQPAPDRHGPRADFLRHLVQVEKASSVDVETAAMGASDQLLALPSCRRCLARALSAGMLAQRCSSSYYAQAAHGQLSLLAQTRADRRLAGRSRHHAAKLRQRLATARQIRRFAVAASWPAGQ